MPDYNISSQELPEIAQEGEDELELLICGVDILPVASSEARRLKIPPQTTPGKAL
jgi:hypothetical protein